MATIVGFLVVYTLNGIRSEIREIKEKVERIESDLRDRHEDLAERVAKIEANCLALHK
jgi:hypothetical protein